VTSQLRNTKVTQGWSTSDVVLLSKTCLNTFAVFSFDVGVRDNIVNMLMCLREIVNRLNGCAWVCGRENVNKSIVY
jgi:hypothetical protein